MILDDILRVTTARVASLSEPSLGTRRPQERRSLAAAIRSRGKSPVIIGEIKPASPSSGVIRLVPNVSRLAMAYTAGGCRGLSVLTEPDFFGGSLPLLAEARAACPLPVLRKDFIIDPRQIAESAAAGADAILLIALLLGDRLAAMVREAQLFGLEPLVEVHTEAEADAACNTGAAMIGVNNRDLTTMKVSMETISRIGPILQDERRLVVAMSGYRTVAQVRDARPFCDAVLVGTALMASPDPEALARRLACA